MLDETSKMSSSALVSLEAYLSRAEKLSCEYRECILRPKRIAPILLIALLWQQNMDALAEVTVRLSESTFLISDSIAAPQTERPYPTK